MNVIFFAFLLTILTQPSVSQTDGWPEWPEWPEWVDSTGWPAWPEWPEWTPSSGAGVSVEENGELDTSDTTTEVQEAAVTVETGEGFETVGQALSSREDLSFFYDTVVAAGLSNLLDFQDYTETTIFAPTNTAMSAAFGNLGYLSFLDFTNNPDKMKIIVAYHIMPYTNIFSTDLVGGAFADMLASQVLNTRVDLSDGVGLIAQGSEAKVLEADIVAGNSVIHIIDTVLLPFDPVIEKEINDALIALGEFTSVNEVFENVPSLSTFGAVVEAAGMSPEISEEIFSGGTVFIPSNDAFDNLLYNLGAGSLQDLTKDQALLEIILATHVISDTALLWDLESDQEWSNVYGGTVTINGFPFLTVVSDGAAANILNFDISAGDVNIFIIDDVLLPWVVTNEILQKVQNVADMEV